MDKPAVIDRWELSSANYPRRDEHPTQRRYEKRGGSWPR
jgi:hypothetical protein